MPTALTSTAKRYRTQWSAQFLAAAELVRRGYIVSFTMGNHTPVADLMVGTQSGEQFWVDVKGQSGKSDWIITPKAPHLMLFYILVYLSPLTEPGTPRGRDEFFVMTQEEINACEEGYRRERPNNKTSMRGFLFKTAVPHREKWEKLPIV